MPTKKLVKDWLTITDEQKIRNQVQEKKDTGSFQAWVQVEDINPNAPKTPTTQIGQGTEAQNITDAPSLAKAVWAEPWKLDVPETQPLPKTDTFDSIDPKTWQKFNADWTPYQEPTQTDGFIDKWNQQIQQADELKDKALEDLKVERDKAVDDTKRGFALWKAKFDENKANYVNYQEVNTKYNAVVDEITSNMSDTGVVDESVYQSIANKYWLTIEQVKNPNRILDEAELTEEGKENLWVNNFEKGIEDSTKNFERRKEDLENRLTQTQQSYNNQIEDAQRSITDAISGMTASGASSWLFRSTALQDSMNRTREDWTRVIDRIRNVKNRAIWDITTSISRITDDFESSISEAQKNFKENYKEVNVENMLALNEIGLNLTWDKLSKALSDIEDEFGVKSQAVFQSYMNNLTAINSAVNENMDLVERITDQEEEKELKTYNEYLANDWLLLQSSNLDDIIRWVQEGKITPESAQNLRKIMQTSIQSTLWAIAPLELWDIDNINYLLENGYTPEQAIALMQESFDKFKATEEIQYREFNGNLYKETATGLELVQEWDKTTDKPFTVSSGSSVYDPVTGTFKTPEWVSWEWLWDLRSLAWNYPWQAWAKNNNPAWITWNANFDNPRDWTTAQRLIDAWVNFSKGTSRPASEWGNYVTFDTMEDWLKAQRILMSWTYGNSTVWQMLQSWVGTSEWPNYAKQVAWNAGIDTGVRVSDLSDIELAQLQAAKIRKESPWLADLLESKTKESDITTNDEMQFRLAESMTWNAKVDFLKEQWLYDKYLKRQESIASTKEKYREYVNEYNSTLKLGTGISEKDAELIMQEFNDAIAREDEEWMKTAIFRWVVAKNDDNKPVFDTYKSTIKNLNDIQEAHKRYTEKGWKTGILNWSLEKISQKIWKTTDPDLAIINAWINGILALYVKDISGAAVTDAERQFIATMLPSIQNVKWLNDVLSQTFIKRIRNGAEQPIRSTVQSDDIYDEVFKPHFMLKEVDWITKTKYDIDKNMDTTTSEDIEEKPVDKDTIKANNWKTYTIKVK